MKRNHSPEKCLLPQYREFGNFSEVSRLEPKRCYVVSQVFNQLNRGKSRYMPALGREEFLERLQRVKDEVLALSEKKLDARIYLKKHPRRLRYYDSVRWYKGVVYPEEVGVWKGAGGLPFGWTQGSLAETAAKVIGALENTGNNQLAARARRAIPRIRTHLEIIEEEPYLYPIILPGATNGRGLRGKPYKGFELMAGDIDDGCMRAISFIAGGRNSFRAYVGLNPGS